MKLKHFTIQTLIGLGVVSLSMSQCQISPIGNITPTVSVIRTENPTSTVTTAASPTTYMADPTSTLAREFMDVPYSVEKKTCPRPATLTKAPFSANGYLIVAAGRHDLGTYGVYILGRDQEQPELLALEENWIGKLVVSPDNKWLIYNIYCSSEQCSGGPKPLEWVMMTLDKQSVVRIPWDGSYGVANWKLFRSTQDGFEIARIPNPLYGANFSDFSLVSLPSGNTLPFPVQASLPDFTNGPVIASTMISVDSEWLRALYYSVDISSGDSDIVLRDLENNITIWKARDDHRIIGSGYGFSWPWAPNGSFVALTFSSREQTDSNRKQGELFILDRDGSAFSQISSFSDTYSGSYYASAGPWSPDSRKIVFTVYTFASSDPPKLYVADLDGQKIYDSCYEGDPNGVWSPDGRYFATSVMANGSERSLLIIDVIESETIQVATAVDAVYTWLP